MDEIISTVVANGIWAVLFCGLLVFELKDSRKREAGYTGLISVLSERLATVNAIENDAQTLKTDVTEIKDKATDIKADTAAVRAAVVKKRPAGGVGGASCATT